MVQISEHMQMQSNQVEGTLSIHLKYVLLIFPAGENLKMIKILVVVDNVFAFKREINVDCSIVQFI